MPNRLPNFLLRSSSGYEHKLLRYNDYGAIALLESGEDRTPYVLVKELRPIPGGKHAWIYINAFSERSVAVSEFENECYMHRKRRENE